MQLSEELRNLYQEVILDHHRSPRNYGKIDHPTHYAEGYNPLCGDHIVLTLQVDNDGNIASARFESKGCAISRASASLMTEEIIGKRIDEVHTLFQRFHEAVTTDTDPSSLQRELGKLIVLLGVRDFPTRVKCATLPWHTLEQALNGGGTATTE
ncbi:MAG: SUF system NifU family Fe-S cluster assembly protein [Candidatus Kapabacteria bacterium]|nr:SUF system NifU family Fe-S cluster assembly protein [Candidatus Kapabacteria bacterium]